MKTDCTGCIAIKNKSSREGVTWFKLFGFLFRSKIRCNKCGNGYFLSTGKKTSLLYAIPLGVFSFTLYLDVKFSLNFFDSFFIFNTALVICLFIFLLQVRRPFKMVLLEKSKIALRYRILGLVVAGNLCILLWLEMMINYILKMFSAF